MTENKASKMDLKLKEFILFNQKFMLYSKLAAIQ